MRQAAIFNSGLMILLGTEMSEIGPSDNLMALPTKVLKEMFTDMVTVGASGVATFKIWSDGDAVFDVCRTLDGYKVRRDSAFSLTIAPEEANDLRELLFGKYSNAPGFYWDKPVAEEV